MENLKFVFCRTGHPVRLVLDREDDMLITGGRHPLFGKYKVSTTCKIIKVPHFVCVASRPLLSFFILLNSKSNQYLKYPKMVIFWIPMTFYDELFI